MCVLLVYQLVSCQVGEQGDRASWRKQKEDNEMRGGSVVATREKNVTVHVKNISR